MATTSNVSILHGEDNELNKLHVPVGTATVLARGDLIIYSGGAGIAMTANTDNTAFMGACLDLSRNGDTDDINVLLKGRLNITVSSSTYAIGEALTYNAGANGTAWVLAAVSSGAKGVAFSLQYKAANVTSLDVQINSFLVGISIGSGSGFWEGFAS
jgi:hypothetical protein